MNGWSLVGVIALCVGTAAWEVVRHRDREVLGAVLLGELGLVLGATLGLVVPGGAIVGAVGGMALAWQRLEAIRERQRAALDAGVAGAASKGELRLLLADRADALAERDVSRAHYAGVLAVAVLSILAVWMILVGAAMRSVTTPLAGAALAFLPSAALAQRHVAGRALKDVSRLLTALDDP